MSEAADIETRLTRHVADLRYEQLPAHARVATARLLMDTAGVMIAGLRGPEPRALIQRYRSWGGAPEASVTGSEQRLPAPAAAFLGGVLAHWYEWDDTHDDSSVHAAAVIYPVLLAAAEAAGRDESRDGREFVTAVVASYDVACRLTAPIHRVAHQGWMPTGSGGSIGAAAGAARLLGLGEAGIKNAMGIAAESAGLSRQALADRVNGKNVLCGLAASQAINAAFLAQARIQGPPQFATGKFGLVALLAGGEADSAEIEAGLGQRYTIAESSVKAYPACRSTHPAIDVMLDLLEESGAGHGDVRSVDVMAPTAIVGLVGAPFDPRDDPRVAAQFSIPYTLAVAARRRHVGIDDFDPVRVVSDSGVLDLARRVTVRSVERESAAAWWRPLTVRVVFADGATFARSVGELKGSPGRPLSAAEDRAKFRNGVGAMLPSPEVERLAEACMSVAETGVAPVMRLLRAARPASSTADTRRPQAAAL